MCISSSLLSSSRASSFFLNGTATTEIYTLSLHDALPISALFSRALREKFGVTGDMPCHQNRAPRRPARSEEHTSELQSLRHLVCRLLLAKKNAGLGGPRQHAAQAVPLGGLRSRWWAHPAE